MQIVYLNCPKCRRQFYIHEEFAGQGYDWFCPYCRHEFTEADAEAAEGRTAAADEARRQDSPSGGAVGTE